MKPKIRFPSPRLSLWHAKTNKAGKDAASSSGREAPLMHTLGTSAGLAPRCSDGRVPSGGAQARLFPSGGDQRMGMPLDKASLKLLGAGRVTRGRLPAIYLHLWVYTGVGVQPAVSLRHMGTGWVAL